MEFFSGVSGIAFHRPFVESGVGSKSSASLTEIGMGGVSCTDAAEKLSGSTLNAQVVGHTPCIRE